MRALLYGGLKSTTRSSRLYPCSAASIIKFSRTTTDSKFSSGIPRRNHHRCSFSTSVSLCETEETKSTTVNMSKPKSKELAVPKPSASVLLISPTNQILLLHRVKTSSAFPSAHVFPGGNLDSFHDGKIPDPQDPQRHEDGEAYRLGAIRETFEESGILLAKNNGFGRLIEVADDAREAGRKEIHGRKVLFTKWLASHGGRADVDGLIPFTRWVTPTNVPKRFTTQMYIYFLPLSATSDPYRGDAGSSIGPVSSSTSSPVMIPVPTHDGGLEHTAARFLPPSKWISMADSGEIILFPPQYFLLSTIGRFLTPLDEPTPAALGAQRKALRQYLRTGDPPWADVCISPTQFMRSKKDGRAILGLDKPGPELKDTDRRGISDFVVYVEFKKEGPRRVQVRKKTDVLEEERKLKEKL